MIWQDWTLLGLVIGVPLIGLATRTSIKTFIEKKIQHGFDERLESMRAEFRRSEELLKSELRLREAERSVLHSTIMSGRNQRQALLDKRRIEAVEQLWVSTMALAPYKNLAVTMSIINFVNTAERIKKDPQLKQFINSLLKAHIPQDKEGISRSVHSERPFLSPLSWAFYAAYEAIVFGAYARAKVLEIGYDATDSLDFKPLRDILIAALPHQKNFIEKNDAAAYYHLLDELEAKLMIELRHNLDGDAEDQQRVEQAVTILSYVAKESENKAIEAAKMERMQTDGIAMDVLRTT